MEKLKACPFCGSEAHIEKGKARFKNNKARRRICESGDCNNCKSEPTCDMKPKPGQMARYNCPFYVDALCGGR